MAASRDEDLSRRSVLAAALRHPELRSLALIFMCFKVAEMGTWIAVTTIAHQNGGIDEAARVVVAQLAPATLAATGVSSLARRLGLRRVLCGGLFLQGAALLGIAALLWTDAPNLAVYGLAVIAAIAVVTTRPTVATVMPLVVEGPHELTAANSVVGWLDGAALMIGPVITAVGFAVAGTASPFVVFSLLTCTAAIVALRITPADRPGLDHATRAVSVRVSEAPEPMLGPDPARLRPDIRAILAVLASHAFVIGALDLLFVVVAIDVTNGPPARASWLNTAFGLGALIGGAASALLIGRTHLWPTVVGAGVGAASTIALVGQPTHVALSALTFGACGLCSAVLFVAARTLLQRCCDFDALCGAFSMAEAAEMAMLLLGALTVPFLVDSLDAALAPVGVAAVLLAAVLSSASRIAAVERQVHAPLERVGQLRANELFATLPAPTLETLARESEVITVPTGTVVIAQGDPGDRYYVITAGEVAVRRDEAEVARLRSGDGFGELALLLDVPRNATVVALTKAHLLAIGRTPFLVALTGQPVSSAPRHL